MRLDKFLKNARIIKRRSVASAACSSGHVQINDKVAKPSTDVKIGDVLTMTFGEKVYKYEVLDIKEIVTKDQSSELYRVIS